MMPDVSAGLGATAIQASERPATTRAWLSLAVGLVTVGATAVLLSGTNSPLLEVPLAVILVCLAPTSSRLDRRIATNLSLAFGFVPFALSMPPVLGARTAAVASLSLATGASAAALALRPTRARLTLRWRDASIALGALLAGLVALPLSSPDGPRGALSLLSANIDNAFHFEMFLERRLMTANSPLVAANADATGFAFDDYPQWLHKLLTVLAQIGFGDPGSAPTELVRFAQLEWIIFVALVVLVTAAFLQALPERTPALLLAPALAVVFSLLVGVPGPINLIQGHLSFLVAACAPLVMFLLAYPKERVGPGLLLVLAGLVLVTASWFLLLPMAAAALLPTLIEIWRRQKGLVRWLTLGILGVTAGAIVPLFVIGPLSHGAFAALLNDGAIARIGLPTTGAVMGASLLLMTALARRRDAPRLTRHILVIVAAILPTAALACFMLTQVGELRYYFWKLALGSLIVAALVATHGVVVFVRSTSHSRGSRPQAIGAVVIGLVAALGLGSALQDSAAPSAAWTAMTPHSLEAREANGAAGDATLPLHLAAVMTPRDAAHTSLIATRPSDMNPVHAAEWFHALSHSSTRRSADLTHAVYQLVDERGNLRLGVELARRALVQGDARVLVTDPELYRRILSAIQVSQRPRVSLVS
ncbi:hypothetical protein GCM10009740_03080 [Terrabacter terrae]|uniref:Uncharacterized protein n=1 Tax=Terrabacter terrae TaxID=318434 RepID=A0ABN2TS19_9MICO